MKATSGNRESGYSLLQMAIALLVAGVIGGSLLSGYALYEKRLAIQTTEDKVKLAINALQKFKQLNGRLPCPASLGAPYGSAPYGMETDCADTSIAPGSVPTQGSTTAGGLDGVGIQTSVRVPALTQPRVRYGMLPFRSLNMAEEDAYDAYGSRMVYVLTESMGVRLTANNNNGGIGIVDNKPIPESVIQPPNSAIFAVFSPGPDRAGGYTKTGVVPIPCGAGMDAQNCNGGAAPIYRTALKSYSNGAPHYDDTINFFSELPDTYWVREEAAPDNIVDTSPDGVGVGTATPAVELDIANSWSAGQTTVPQGTLRASTKVKADKICPQNSVGTDANCFETRNLAGDITTGTPGTEAAPGDGMKCPTGKYMNGIQGGKPICKDAEVRCNVATQILTGVTSAGAAICNYKPCPVTVKSDCSENKSLPVGAATTTASLTFGANRLITYRCDANSTTVQWNQISASGSCSCTETDITDHPSCGPYHGGATCTRIRHRSCPSGNLTETFNDCATTCPTLCVAQPSPYIPNTQSCPAYTSGTGIWDEYVFSMAACNYIFDKHHDDCTCTAQPDRNVKLGDCPAGNTGTGIFQHQTFNLSTCSYNTSEPTTSDCVCNTTETQVIYEDPVCPAGKTVLTKNKYSQLRDGPDCSWGSKTLVETGTCTPINYTWKIIASPGTTSPTQIGPLANESCTYAQYMTAANLSCSVIVGSQYAINECQCLP